MALRKIDFTEGETYHVYNRGNSKKEIFHDVQDYERFRALLYLCNGEKRFEYKDLVKMKQNVYDFAKGKPLVDILAYVLMPNHFHLLVHVPGTKEPYGGVNKNLNNALSIFMRRLTAAYSMYYNLKYGRTGSLFEGRFKAEHVNNDNYYKYLFSYIHLNPIKLIQKDWREIGIKDFNEARKFLESYKYSSLSNYFSGVPYAGILNTNEFLSRLEPGTDLSKEIFTWLNFRTIE